MDRITPQGYDFPRKVTNPFWGGGSGTTDYNDLENKPSIEGTTLVGDLTLADIGVEPLTEEQIAILKTLI